LDFQDLEDVMEAIILAGGKQYRVKKGQKLSVDKLSADVNAEVKFDTLMVLDGDKATVGTPIVGKGKVLATVVRQYKDEKVTSATYKRRKGFHKKKGHRQCLTEIQIKDILS
jgi:large subunit ribosomal protein L21